MSTTSNGIAKSVGSGSLRQSHLEASINNPTPPKVEATVTADSGGDMERDMENGSKVRKEEPLRASQVKTERTKIFVILVAMVAAFGGLIFGYDIAGAGATFVMEGFQLHFGWECADESSPDYDPGCVPKTQSEQDTDKALINALFGIGAAFGALIAPWFSSKNGRRPTLSLAAVVFIIGASIQTASPTMGVMWCGRIFSGMGIGMLSCVCPVYTAECAPEHIRGSLGTLWQLAITLGIVIASAANLGLKDWDEGWRISYGGNILFALIMLVCLCFMPESPRWLGAHKSEEETKKALARIRFEEEVDPEFEKIVIEIEEEKEQGVAPWSECWSQHNMMRRRMSLGIWFFAFQQLAGINAVMFYAPDIINNFFSESASIYGTFFLNCVNFLSTFITVFTVDKFGRTKLLITGGSFMFIFLFIIGILAAVEQSEKIGYAVVTMCALYIVAFASTWGPVLWVIVGEMFPYRTRGKGVGGATMSHWIFTTIVGAVFPHASSWCLSCCFFFFAVMVFCGNWVVYLYQPETAGKTAEQIDEAYAAHKPGMKRKDW